MIPVDANSWHVRALKSEPYSTRLGESPHGSHRCPDGLGEMPHVIASM